MKASQFFVSTLKEAPADAEVVSHRLMMRAGMIKRLGAGIYNYMPMGLRVIRKVEKIIREEMDAAGAVECLMPVIQPAELWQETGRFDKMGPELLRVKDRHGRDFIVQPTSEEVITDIARQELRSYRQLPKNFYHIQTKFRDERRPRFGLMRGREFTMKDAYSFDRDVEAAGRSYDNMYAAYGKIFDRFGLQYRAVAADTGAIGGDRSHEFQVIAETGEDAIVYCPTSDYAANIELAEAVALLPGRADALQTLTKTPTPGKATCAEVALLLGLPLAQTVKSLVLATDELDKDGNIVKTQVWLLLVRGDHDLNEVKAGKVEGLKGGFRFATSGEIDAHFGCKPGYLGPIGLKQPLKIVADRTVAVMSDFVCGANEADFHFTGANWGRDLPEPDVVADIRNVVAGDPSPDGKGLLAIQRGIIWPDAIAPFTVVICPIGMDRSEEVKAAAHKLYEELKALGVDVLLDDRGERPGAMFADWELIGVPHRVVLGDRGLKEGQVEYQGRRDEAATKLAVADVVGHLKGLLKL
ncbi:proline--tRNA ligase [Roseateles sp. P5_E11]